MNPPLEFTRKWFLVLSAFSVGHFDGSLSMGSNLGEHPMDGFPNTHQQVLGASAPSAREVLINCRNNRKILARVKAFDRHSNMARQPRSVQIRTPADGKTNGKTPWWGHLNPNLAPIREGSPTKIDSEKRVPLF